MALSLLFCYLFVALSVNVASARLSSSQPIGQQFLTGSQPRTLSSTAIPLNFSSPSPHIFSSLRSLLQQWPNTVFPNGHSIVPCEVPAYTNLYHGRKDAKIPPSPEWFAFDIEMSYGIMGSNRRSHMLTYQTIKPVKCLYFDGMSASLSGTGQLDSQMVFLYGNTSGPFGPAPFFGWMYEYDRARGLCDWVKKNGIGGLGWGVEGFVRMNSGFEIIWCQFSSPSIRLVSHLNVTAPLLPVDFRERSNASLVDDLEPLGQGLRLLEERASKTIHPLPPLPSSTENVGPIPTVPGLPDWDTRDREPFLRSGNAEWFRSATWHYGASGLGPGRGESRVKLLTCGFMSYYDSAFPKLALARAADDREYFNLTTAGDWKGPGRAANRTVALQELTRRRRNHTLASIDAVEALFMNQAIAQVLDSLESSERDVHCSGMNWAALSFEIATRYSATLSQFLRFLSTVPQSFSHVSLTREFLTTARVKAHALLMPFLEYPLTAPEDRSVDSSVWNFQSEIGQATFSRCKYAYTRLLYDISGTLYGYINRQERVMVEAVEDVLSAICTVTIKVGFEIEREWLSILAESTSTTPTVFSAPVLRRQVKSWKEELELVMAWLGWAGDDIRCEQICSKDEYCYIPMWPVIMREGPNPPRRRPPPYDDRPDNGTKPTRPSPDYPGGPYGSGPPGYGPPPFFDAEENLWSPRCMKIRE